MAIFINQNITISIGVARHFLFIRCDYQEILCFFKQKLKLNFGNFTHIFFECNAKEFMSDEEVKK